MYEELDKCLEDMYYSTKKLRNGIERMPTQKQVTVVMITASFIFYTGIYYILTLTG